MKLKVSLVFLALAAVFVYFMLKGNYFTSQKIEKMATQSYTSDAILKQILSLDLRDYQGNKFVLDDSALRKSKNVVVHLWASWCGPCVGEVPELIEFSKKNPDVSIVVVSLDDYQDDIEKFMKSFPEFNSGRFSKIWDNSKVISKYLDADRLPMTVILTRDRQEPQMIKSVVDWKHIKI